MVQMSMAHVETYIYIFIYILIWSCILTSKSTYIYVHMYDKFMSCIVLWVPPPAYTPVGYVWTSIHSMEKRCCKICNSSRGAGAAALYEDRKYCTICLDMEKEKHRRIREDRLEYFEKYHEEHQEERKDYRKEYSQIEIACAICKCTVRKCGWAKHIVTDKQKKYWIKTW